MVLLVPRSRGSGPQAGGPSVLPLGNVRGHLVKLGRSRLACPDVLASLCSTTFRALWHEH